MYKVQEAYIRGNKDKSKQFSQTYATKSALYYGKVQNKYIKLNIHFFAQPKRYNHEQIIDSWDHECLLNIPQTNCVSCWITTETSEPAANDGRTSRAEGCSRRIHEHWAPGDHLALHIYQIDAIFINKPQIWVLNYILAWKTLKTTFHDTITVIFWKVFGQWRFTSQQ